MPLYREGSVSLTQGSRTVIGTNTEFGLNARPGDILALTDAFYQVLSVQSDTELTLDIPAVNNYSGTTYALLQSVNTDNNRYLMQKVEEFLKDRQRTISEFNEWVTGEEGGGEGGTVGTR